MTITNEPTPELKEGRVVTIAGPVVDIEFPPNSLPEINQCVSMTVTLDTSGFSRPVGTPASVAATVSCTVELSELSLPGQPDRG